jgi:hypothetical protein
MDRDRVPAVNAKSLDQYFERLNECITRSHIDPDNIWDFNEKGFMMGSGGNKSELVISRVQVNAPGECNKEVGNGFDRQLEKYYLPSKSIQE